MIFLNIPQLAEPQNASTALAIFTAPRAQATTWRRISQRNSLLQRLPRHQTRDLRLARLRIINHRSLNRNRGLRNTELASASLSPGTPAKHSTPATLHWTHNFTGILRSEGTQASDCSVRVRAISACGVRVPAPAFAARARGCAGICYPGKGTEREAWKGAARQDFLVRRSGKDS